MRKPAVALAAVLALGALAASGADVSAAAAQKQRAKSVQLKAFKSCPQLLRYARRTALRNVEPGRLEPFGEPTRRVVNPLPGLGVPERAPATGGPVSEDFSRTNVQEAGIDEPDVVKTDGKTIFAVAGSKLHAVDVTGAQPRRVDSLKLANGFGAELLLSGDRLLVIAGGSGGYPDVPVAAQAPRSIAPPYIESKTVLKLIDVSMPGALRVLSTLTVDGSFLSARLNEGTARLAITSPPPALELPVPLGTPESSQPSGHQRNRAALRRSRLRRWVPAYTLRRRGKARATKRRLVRCRAVRRANRFAGLDMLSVLTIDLGKGLTPVDTDGLMTTADTVYASAKGFYLATQRWVNPEASVERQSAGMQTELHKFAIAGSGETAYRASGSVPGSLLNQFSLSEHDGFLRAATTREPLWTNGGRDGESESFVTVLDERDGRLVRVGRVGGLGRGERIYSVRFIEDTGYVVTFRQVDPLYVVDLAKPGAPRVVGELKIRGYSAYLHPADEGRLIGVGQDATEEGRTLGTQISLFDVSDPAQPRRLHRRTVMEGSSSAVEYDHHAFLWWAPTKLAVLPIEAYSEPAFTGAIGFRIDGGIAEVGRVRHDVGRYDESISRSLVVKDRLYTLSDSALGASKLATLAPLAWVALD